MPDTIAKNNLSTSWAGERSMARRLERGGTGDTRPPRRGGGRSGRVVRWLLEHESSRMTRHGRTHR